jgi:hypothetical protein
MSPSQNVNKKGQDHLVVFLYVRVYLTIRKILQGTSFVHSMKATFGSSFYNI